MILNSHYLVFSCESFKLFKKMLCRQTRSLDWNYACTSPKYCIFAYSKRSVLKAYFLSVPYSASDHFSELSSLALFTCFVPRLPECVKLDCLGKTWLSCLYGVNDCTSTQTNVQRFILRKNERWFQGDEKGNTNHQWQVEKSNDVSRRTYRFNVLMAILLDPTQLLVFTWRH